MFIPLDIRVHYAQQRHASGEPRVLKEWDAEVGKAHLYRHWLGRKMA